MSYTELENKIGVDQARPVIENIYDSGVVNMGTGAIAIPNNPIKSNYPIDSLLVKLKVATTVGTGTLASVAIFNALTNLQLNDKNNVQICNFLGSDVIAEAYLRSFIVSRAYGNNRLPGTLGAGTTSLTTNVASGSNEVTVLLRFPVKNKDLPLKILGFFGALSSIYSTVGTGTATIELIIDAIMYPTKDPVWTVRTQKTNTGAAAPVANAVDISKLLPDGLVIDLLILSVAADANWTALTYDPNGNGTGYQQITEDSKIQIETAELSPTSRQANYAILKVGQFVKTSKSKFTIDVATGFTPYAFIMYHPISDQPQVKAAPAGAASGTAKAVAAVAPTS